MKVSKFTYICTSTLVAAHQRLASIPEIEVPTTVTREECHQMITERKWKGPDGVNHPIAMGKKTIFTFFAAGRQEISGSTIQCVGEQVKLGDRLVDGVAILEQIRMELKPVTIRFDSLSRGAEVKEEHSMLPRSCDIFDHYCQLDEATFLWGTVSPTLYQKVNHFSGKLIMQEGEEVVISDTQKVRMVLGKATQVMGRSFKTTKYPNIFIIEGDADYLDAFPSDHLKLGAYIAARDDYLAYALERQLLKAIDLINHSNCKRTQDLARTQMNLAAHSDDGMQYLVMGENEFGVLWGEALHSFNCRKVQVVPRAADICSKELPVHLDGRSKYLHPITRLLSDHATVVPCSLIMGAKFHTLRDEWVAATPQLQVVPAPQQIPGQQEIYTLNHTDLSTGGIYTDDQVQEFSNLLNFPRVRQAVKNSMVHDLCQDNHHPLCLHVRQSLGPQVLKQPSIFHFRQRILNFLHTFGEAAATLIALWMLGQGLIWVISMIINIINLKEVKGIRKICQLFWPILLVNYDYGRMARGARQRQQEEQLQRQEEMRDLIPDPERGQDQDQEEKERRPAIK